MSLEKIINSGKRILGISILTGALAVSPFLGGCRKSEDDQKSNQNHQVAIGIETQAPSISEKLQEQWPIWELTDLEVNKYKGPTAVYDKQLNVKPSFYNEPMPLKYKGSMTISGLGPTYSKILNYKFKDFSNYFIYDGSDLVGAVSVDNNNKMVAEAKIDPYNITNEERVYNPNFKVEEFHYSGGLLVFHCISQFEKGLGMKQEEANPSGKKQRDYFFILPFGASK